MPWWGWLLVSLFGLWALGGSIAVMAFLVRLSKTWRW